MPCTAVSAIAGNDHTVDARIANPPSLAARVFREGDAGSNGSLRLRGAALHRAAAPEGSEASLRIVRVILLACE